MKRGVPAEPLAPEGRRERSELFKHIVSTNALKKTKDVAFIFRCMFSK
jgi:hypothetical protein